MHVVFRGTVIKITQFPNSVRVFAGLEQELFHGWKMCSCPTPHDLKPLPLGLIAQKQLNGAFYAPTYLKLFKNSHMEPRV